MSDKHLLAVVVDGALEGADAVGTTRQSLPEANGI